MKNVQRSALALTLLIAVSAQAFELPSMPALPALPAAVNLKNGAIATGVTAVAFGAYKYRNSIKNGASVAVEKIKDYSSKLKTVVMNNKGKVAAVAAVTVLAVVAYKKFFGATPVVGEPSVTPTAPEGTPVDVTPIEVTPVEPTVTPEVNVPSLEVDADLGK